MDDNCLATIADYKYLNFLECFIRSLNKNSLNISINVHLINCSDDDILRIQSLGENVKITTKVKSKNTCVYNIDDINRMRGYCINSRTKFLSKLVNKYKRILFIDANTIFNKDMTNFFKVLEDVDIYGVKRDKNKTFLCGMVGIRSSVIMKRFIKLWILDVKKRGYYEWNNDQLSFYKIYMQLKDNIIFKSFPGIYSNWSRTDEHDMWIAKGIRMDTDMIFNSRRYNYIRNDISNITVDIVIPIYNPDLINLKECIESINNQSYKYWILHIVDDGNTTKNSKRIYKLIRNNIKIKYYKNYRHMGLVHSLNCGHNKGNSCYITWLHQDSYYELDFLEKMFEYISVNKYDFINSSDKYINNKNKGTIYEPYNIIKYGKNVILGRSFMYTRDIYYKTIGYDNRLKGCMELDFMWQLHNISDIKLGNIENTLCTYREYPYYMIKKFQDLDKFKIRWVTNNVICECKTSKKCKCVIYKCQKCINHKNK
jgi:hypothetical protein